MIAPPPAPAQTSSPSEILEGEGQKRYLQSLGETTKYSTVNVVHSMSAYARTDIMYIHNCST